MDLAEQQPVSTTRPAKSFAGGRLKFIVGGLLIAAAVIYLIWTSATANAQYFMTVDEVLTRGQAAAGRELRVSGAVIGDTIQYDSQNLMLEFAVAHTPGNQKEVDAQGGMAEVLHAAVIDPNRARLSVVYSGVMPDLLRNEAQAIMTGKLGEDGKFYAQELLLKCPTRYEEAVPEQASSEN